MPWPYVEPMYKIHGISVQTDVETSLATVFSHDPKWPQVNEAKPRLTSPPDNSGITQTSKEVPVATASHQVNDSPELDLTLYLTCIQDAPLL